ncbi:MAG TPA: Uma2 family endonuclease [Burkholderiales bacterium]|nr:Uma2 family endonuclease [Burkholderiales bacterium]
MNPDPALRSADVPVPRDDLIRGWQSLAADPESPDCFELDQFGELILSPKPTTGHQRVASEIAWALRSQIGGEGVTDRWAACKGQSPLEVVPDVCVEVLSPSNTREEIEMKVRAYLRSGAREVIVVALKGEIEIFGPRGKRDASTLGIALVLPVEPF